MDNGTVTIKVVDSKTGKVLSGATVNINGQILHTNSNGEVQVSNVKPGNIKQQLQMKDTLMDKLQLN